MEKRRAVFKTRGCGVSPQFEFVTTVARRARRPSHWIFALTFALTFPIISVGVSQVTATIQEKVTAEKFRSAARNGDLETVKKGIEAGIDVDAKSAYGATALFFACDRGHEEVVNYLLQQGADPNVRDTFYKATPVTWSMSGDNQNITLSLIEHGGDFDRVLTRAINQGDVDFAKKIVALKSEQKEAMVKARDAALRIKDEDQKKEMVAIFESLDLPEPVAATAKAEKADPKVKKAEPKKETSAKPASKFAPSKAESLAADLKISSANWPGFRGAGSRGVAEGQRPPIDFHVAASGGQEGEDAAATRESELLLWKTPVEGLGLSCPVIWNDQIFITTAVTEGDAGELRTGLYGDVDSVEESQEYEFKLLCFSKTSGGLLWERTAHKAKPAVKRHAKSSHANPTVVTDGEHVVAFFASEGLYCYSKDGDLIWKESFGFLDSGWFYDKGYQWGFASSPAIHKGKLYVQCDIQSASESTPKGSFVTCMDLKTGDEVWRTERDEIPSWSTPLIHEFDDRTMVITNSTKSSRGYDADTGELIWSMKGNSEIVVPTPNVAHGLIYVASGYSPIRPIYAIKPNAKGDISLEADQDSNEGVAWSRKSGGPYMPSPVIYGDYLYTCANNGVLTCYVATTGEQVYRKRLKAGSGSGRLAFTASPLAGDGHLYLTAEDGRVLVVKAGPDYEVVATNLLNEKILATPAISEGAMFFRTQKSLIAVGQRITD